MEAVLFINIIDKDKVAFPGEAPTKYCEVTVPPKVKLRAGKCGKVVGDDGVLWGNGGAKQCEILDKQTISGDWFGEVKGFNE